MIAHTWPPKAADLYPHLCFGRGTETFQFRDLLKMPLYWSGTKDVGKGQPKAAAMAPNSDMPPADFRGHDRDSSKEVMRWGRNRAWPPEQFSHGEACDQRTRAITCRKV